MILEYSLKRAQGKGTAGSTGITSNHNFFFLAKC